MMSPWMYMIRLHQLLPSNTEFCVKDNVNYVICSVNPKEWNIDIALCEQLPIRVDHIIRFSIMYIGPT